MSTMNGSQLLHGLSCVVIGGARGVGQAVSERFVEEGARVVVGDVLDEEGEEVARRIGGRYVHVDVTDRASIEAARDVAVAEHGRVDVLVANAAVMLQEHLLDMDVQMWQRTLDINLTGVFHACQVFGRRMREQGDGGRILITASIGGMKGGEYYGAYAASKFGVIGMSRSLAVELAPEGILVNSVSPGTVDTEMMADLVQVQARLAGRDVEDVSAENRAMIPIGRYAVPREVADIFVFLASPLARYMTGHSLIVDGGMMA